MKSDFLSSQKTQLTVILLAYAIFASIFGFAYRYAMNPDGISLIRLAEYIAEGNLWQSVSGGWEPLITWLMAPFLYFGFKGLSAARLAIAISGGLMVVGSWLLASRFNLSRKVRFIALLMAALLISDWTIRYIAADVISAALLIWYLYILTDPDILTKNKLIFWTGVVGGIGYLAKNYAFPFFIGHFPLMLLLRYYFDKDEKDISKKRIFISLIVGLTGFLAVSSIWIVPLSVKYGHLTVSNKGVITHSLVGPEEARHLPFFTDGLHKFSDPRSIHIFEDPSGLEYRKWSPFESKRYFIYQLGLIRDNINYIVKHFVSESPFFVKTFVLGILTLLPIAFLLSPLDKPRKFLYSWIMLTFTIYCSGYILLTARSPRRFYALMIIFLFLSFHFFEGIKDSVKNIISNRRIRLLTLFLSMIIIPAFIIKPGIHFLRSAKNLITLEQVNPYKEMAAQISATSFPAPYAIIRSAQKNYTDYYIAYYLQKQFSGRPLSSDIEGITKELKSVDAKSLLVFDSPEVVERLKNDSRYIHIANQKFRKDNRYLNAPNIEQDEITGWDREVNIFAVKW